ncbi:DMT family transporter [Paralimibaculum aggregatum]|uniref:DMT family transporter n=1 Tax=Paralimibaculum aggregatum TaxID=3036245 RepID=A0ABQ6LPP5_9RHOB|nr:EamA family transporter [Limibaculum sp. NKW23]GMG82679.1 DMT family transporter [Limibaculum sp. NKW23]
MNAARLTGIAAVLAAALLWGTTGTAQSLLPAAREPMVVGALRLAFGAATLLALALADPACRRALPGLPWGTILFAGAAVAAYNLCFFRAVSEAGIGIGTAVTIGSAPIWATAWETLTHRRLPGGLRLAGQAVSILGVGLLGLTGAGGGSALGIGLALASGASYAAYSLATSAIGHRAPSTAIAAATFGTAALLTAPVLAILPLGWIAGADAWGALAFLGIGATGLAYALYTWGLTRVAASTAVTLVLAEPVTAWCLATFFVGEPATAESIAGAVLILAGLALVTAVPARR